MTEPKHRPRPTTYAKHPAHVWEAVRADFIAGQTLPRCAERHGVSLDAAYWRSRHHGWLADKQAADLEAARRAGDQADTVRARQTPPQPKTPDDAARAAFEQSAQALAEGRPGEAQVWARLARSLGTVKLAGDQGAEADDADTAGLTQFTPGQPTPFDKLTWIAERRLDMLALDFWLGGPWNTKWNRPAFCIDRDGRIVRTSTVEDAWFDRPQGDDTSHRVFYDETIPKCREIPPPHLGWIMEVWLPDWNARHADAPCTEAEAVMIHQLYTRDPRMECGYDDPRVVVARAKWEAEQTAAGLPLPELKPPWAGNVERQERRREANRRLREGDRLEPGAEPEAAGEELYAVNDWQRHEGMLEE